MSWGLHEAWWIGSFGNIRIDGAVAAALNGHNYRGRSRRHFRKRCLACSWERAIEGAAELAYLLGGTLERVTVPDGPIFDWRNRAMRLAQKKSAPPAESTPTRRGRRARVAPRP